jgi:hypothetical protein
VHRFIVVIVLAVGAFIRNASEYRVQRSNNLVYFTMNDRP